MHKSRREECLSVNSPLPISITQLEVSSSLHSDWLKKPLNSLFWVCWKVQSVTASIEVDLLKKMALCMIIGPHQCRKWVYRRWASGKERECHGLATENQSNSSGSQAGYSFFPLCSVQRPYVMRSSTPANEIVQIFHKVHPSYPAAWSLEMKSLLRKVMLHTRVSSQHNRSLIQPCPQFENLLPTWYKASAIVRFNECS